MTSLIETFWTAFLRTLARRGLHGVKLVISDAHEGLKAAVAKVLHASWQRCRVHFMRNVLAHAGKQGRHVVAAFIATFVAAAFVAVALVAARSANPQISRRERNRNHVCRICRIPTDQQEGGAIRGIGPEVQTISLAARTTIFGPGKGLC